MRMMSMLSLLAIVLIPITSTHAGSTCEKMTSGKNGDFKGEASIVYFYMGDSYATTLAQETVALSKAFEKADYKILLYDQNATKMSRVSSAKAISEADSIYTPTQNNFFAAIHEAVDAGYIVNVWIFSHGSSYHSKSLGRDVTYFKSMDGSITNQEIEDEFLGDCELPIRMVYSGACYHAGLNETWLALGAKAAVGAEYINYYPTEYGRFTQEWNNGRSVVNAVSLSENKTTHTLVQAYIAALGLKYSNRGKCGLIPNVLGKNSCAQWFFTGGGPYNSADSYDNRYSGASNMDYSSEKIISGDPSLTRTKVISWDM